MLWCSSSCTCPTDRVLDFRYLLMVPRTSHSLALIARFPCRITSCFSPRKYCSGSVLNISRKFEKAVEPGHPALLNSSEYDLSLTAALSNPTSTC
jgi:hypothetical protein